MSTSASTPDDRDLGKELSQILKRTDDFTTANVDEQRQLLDLYNQKYLRYGENISDMLRGERQQDVQSDFATQRGLLTGYGNDLQGTLEGINPRFRQGLNQSQWTSARYMDRTEPSVREYERATDKFAGWNDYGGQALRDLSGDVRSYYEGSTPEWQRLNRTLGRVENFSQGRGSEWQGANAINRSVNDYVSQYRGNRLPVVFNEPIADSALLGRVARAELAKGGRLSTQEIEDANQAVRSSMAERGLVTSNPAIFAEALNRDELQRQRLQERQAALAQATGIATNIAGTATGAEAQALGLGMENAGNQIGWKRDALALGLTGSQLEHGARQAALGLGLSTAQTMNQRDAAALEARRSVADLRRMRAAEDVGLQFQNAQLQQSALAPLLSFYGRSSSLTAPQINPNVASTANSLLSYGSDLFNTNYNARAAALNSRANNEAGLYSGILQGGAALGGAALLAFCWVARACLGTESGEWLVFRRWMLETGPKWFSALYIRYGERFAKWLRGGGRGRERLRNGIAWWMRGRIKRQLRIEWNQLISEMEAAEW